MELHLDRKDFEWTTNFSWEAETLAALCTCSLTCAGTRKSWAVKILILMAYEAHLWCLEIGSWISVRITAEDSTTEAAVLAYCVSCPVCYKVK